MKRIATLLVMAMALMCVSCDDDAEMAINLEGEWTGDFGMSVADRYGNIFDAEYSNIRFYWDGGSHGHGEQIDYYRFPSPMRWQSYYFTWRVSNGVLYMKYMYDSQLNCAIYDYYMDGSYFTGRIQSTYGGSDFRFKLFKLYDFNGWGIYDTHIGYGYDYYDDYYYDYYGDYGYGYYDDYGYYYSKTRSAKANDENKDGVIVKRFNRYVEKVDGKRVDSADKK